MAMGAGILFFLLFARGGAANTSGVEKVSTRGQLRSIDSLAKIIGSERSYVHVRGVTTLVRRGSAYVQDQTGALAISFPNAIRLAVGEEIELSGFYEGLYPYGRLVDADIRRLWSGSPPVALALQPQNAAEGAYAYRLIETEGRLLNKTLTGPFLQLTLEASGQVFAATLELSTAPRNGEQISRGFKEGSWLRVSGVCAPSRSQDGAPASAFVVLLRSTDDVRVVYDPPWWNLRNVTRLSLAVLLVLLLLHRARIRTINQRFNAVVEERLRIAREIHDTLAQVFVGMTWQLEGLERKLSSSPVMDPARRQLSQTLQLLRHSREDAHRSIFALRSLAQARVELLALLVSSSEPALANTPTRLISISSGEARPLPDDVVSNLLRIGQEAITNASKHAKASHITLALRFESEGVSLEVSDNGIGFDPATAGSPQDGHFGIQGMKERARCIHALLEVKSKPGSGTTIATRVPLASCRSLSVRLGWGRIMGLFSAPRRPMEVRHENDPNPDCG